MTESQLGLIFADRESFHSLITNAVLAHKPADELRDVTDVLTFYCGSVLALLPQSYDHAATLIYHYSSPPSEAITAAASHSITPQPVALALIHSPTESVSGPGQDNLYTELLMGRHDSQNSHSHLLL